MVKDLSASQRLPSEEPYLARDLHHKRWYSVKYPQIFQEQQRKERGSQSLSNLKLKTLFVTFSVTVTLHTAPAIDAGIVIRLLTSAGCPSGNSNRGK